MSAVIEAPRTLVESVAAMRLPDSTDALLQSLMDRNTNGELTTVERVELEALAELSESLAIIRGEAPAPPRTGSDVNPSWAEITRQVTARAGGRCEYCRMHQSLQGATFHIEHIIPRSSGGSDSADNLALACPGCNLGKSNRTVVPDPET